LGLRAAMAARRLARASRPITDPQVVAAAATTRTGLGVRRLDVRESDRVGSPALVGLLAPVVLAPPGLLVELTPVARAHVLLHEIGHLRRRDLWVEALFTLAVALHWWNPLVWIGLRLARADREVACDDWVLRRIGEHGALDYGQSLLAVSAQWRRTEGVLLPVAMVEDRRGLRDRIRRIAFFRRGTWLRGFATGALVAGLGLTALADEPRQNIRDTRWRGQSPPAGYESFRWIGAPDTIR
jgi:bla regulator protein BlaR1